MSLAKEAAALAPPASRHDAYLRRREELKQKGKVWRLSHKEILRRRGKRYRRQVSSGMRVQHQRFRVGTSYVLGGAKARGSVVGAPPLKVTKVQVV